LIRVIRHWSTGVREGLAARPDRVRTAVEAAPYAFSPWLGWQLEQLRAPEL